MFDCSLFLGIKVDPALHQEIQKNPQPLQDLFIQDHPDYLQRTTYQDCSYLGKFIGEKIETSHISMLEANIFSLLCRLAPQYSNENSALMLFPIINTEKI